MRVKVFPPFKWDEDEKPYANVVIKTEGASNAKVYLDGQKVNGLIGYEIIHDRTKTAVPILHLHVLADLNIETGMIPELPEPWNYCYVLKNQIPSDNDAQS